MQANASRRRSTTLSYSDRCSRSSDVGSRRRRRWRDRTREDDASAPGNHRLAVAGRKVRTRTRGPRAMTEAARDARSHRDAADGPPPPSSDEAAAVGRRRAATVATSDRSWRAAVSTVVVAACVTAVLHRGEQATAVYRHWLSAATALWSAGVDQKVTAD